MATTTREPRPEAPNVCRLTLHINGVSYAVRPIPAACFGASGRAWRLRKPDGATHDVAETVHGATCDCGDQTFRHEGIDDIGCKHIRAPRALGILGR
jgi:hypothetical protein